MLIVKIITLKEWRLRKKKMIKCDCGLVTKGEKGFCRCGTNLVAVDYLEEKNGIGK